jgi:cytochrome c-type biogenesis protein CcmF
MVQLGWFALLLAFSLSVYALLIDPLGCWRKNITLIKTARIATIASAICLAASIFALLILFVTDNFNATYVADHSSKNLPLAYKISALWAGASGSLLFWLWLQTAFIVIVFCRFKQECPFFAATARAAANLVSVFFLLVVILDKNPFELLAAAPADGNGLNPLLRHPAMALHPPALFIGYAAFIISFAWTFAALLQSDTQTAIPFFKQIRRWILFAWLFLTIGIVLGAWWAYEVLGWGGYWAWDPVENASLLPWFAATALLHCSRVYKRQTSIETWLMVLSIAVFSLCIFGTFLTRYGLVSSVHAFPEPGLGILFLILLLIIWIITCLLFWLKHNHQTENPVVTATGLKFIVLNNWLMILFIIVVLIGTLFPFFTSLFTQQKITLKPQYFTKITAPFGLILLLLLSVCPYLLSHGFNKNWRTIGAFLTALTALIAWLVTGKLSPACFIICGFAVLSFIADFIGRYKKTDLTRPNLRLLGSRMVHIGVVLVFIGIAGSGGYDFQQDFVLQQGETVTVKNFDITFDDFKTDHRQDFVAVTAQMSVKKDKKHLTTLNPSMFVYTNFRQHSSNVDIRRTLAGDFYLALTGVDDTAGLINLTVIIKPLINWIWIGCSGLIIGSVLVLISFYTNKESKLACPHVLL